MDSDKTSKTRYGFLLLRPLIIAFVLISGYPIFFEIPRTFYFIIAVSVILTIIYFLSSRIIPATIHLHVQFFFDVLIVTAMIIVTGGEESLFPFFYALLIIASSLFLHARGALYVFFLSTLTYSLLLIYIAEKSAIPTIYLVYRFYFFTFLFVVVTILSSVFTERLRKGREEVSKVRLTTTEILKSLPVEILTLDSAGNILFSNIEDSARIEIVKEIMYEGESKEKEITLNNRQYIFVTQPIVNPEHRLLAKLAFLKDVTELRKLQEQSKLAERIKLVAELGASFAHEIRNPLASICGSVEILAQGIRKKSKYEKLTTLILKEASRVNGIIKDFLEFARVRPSAKENVRISELVDESISALPKNTKNIKQVRIQRKMNKKIFAWVDSERIKQAISAILINAFEATMEKGAIRVYVRSRRKEVGIEIRDSGAGIPQKEIERIFDPFYSTKKGGTGLGLAIAQRIVGEHNGYITVDSKPGKGSTFSIWLPEKTN